MFVLDREMPFKVLNDPALGQKLEIVLFSDKYRNVRSTIDAFDGISIGMWFFSKQTVHVLTEESTSLVSS